MNGAISGAGSVLAGTAGTAYPGHLFIRFEETKTSGDLFTATSLTMALYCDQPTILSTTLSGAEAAGQTALSVATDLTADASHWINGAMVRIDGINGLDSEERTINSISATELTVTAGLTNAKISGALVHLISRNVSILGPSATQANGINGGTNGVIRASVRRFNNGFSSGTGHTNSGTISGCTSGFSTGTGHTNSGTISGCTNGIYYGVGHTNSGTISGCTNGIYYGAGHTNSGTISGCTNGINVSAVMLQRGSAISGNTNADIVMPSVVYGYGARLQSATPVSAYTTVSGTRSQNVTMLYDVADSSNNPQVGYYKCWMQSGVIVTSTATVGGPTLSHAHTFANAQDQLRLDLPLRLIAGIPYKWTIQVKSAQAPNGMTLRPTFAICDPHRIVYHASEILASVAVPNDTSTAWQTVTLAYTPTETREYTFRATGQNASGSFEWWSTDVVPTYPAAADVQAGASAYGPTGSEYTPSYPTTATTQAADAATLTGTTLNAAGADTTVAFGASNGTAKSAAVYTAAQAAQLATDKAAVSAKKAYIYPNADILNQNDGTLRASNIGTLAGTDDLASGDLRDGVTVDDVVGGLDIEEDNPPPKGPSLEV
jgi:hypothetical protein